jgi:acetylornithine deacetylase
VIDQHRLLAILSDLVRIPSENTPPEGAEKACQEYIAGFLGKLGWTVDMYGLDEVAGLRDHELFWPGRNYDNRPNVGARCAGAGGGRSLLLSGHIDTVPRGSVPWLHDPFGAAIEDSRLYGRGALDMKAGIAAALLIAETLAGRGIRLGGDLLVESVVDEEFGGVNGTLAGRLRGFHADAAIIGEPTGLRICPGHRGGRVAHLTFRAGGDIFADVQGGGAVEQLRAFLDALPQFAARRREKAPRHPLYAHLTEPAPVAVTSISTAPWGPTEPITVPSSCRVELYWQAAPGETQEEMESQFFEWLGETLRDVPEVEFPIRWLPGSAIEPTHPLVRELGASARDVMGEDPAVEGMEAPCDMYVFHRFGTPASLWGPRGANAHAPDEYVDIKSLVAATETLYAFVTRWCGVAEEAGASVQNRTSAAPNPSPPGS